MPYIGNGTYSHLIVTADLQTPTAAAFTAAAQQHRMMAAATEQEQLRRQTANEVRESAVRSPGSEPMHEANRVLVQEYRIIKEAHLGTAEILERQAQVIQEVDTTHRSYDINAHEKIAAATTKAEIAAIVGQAHTGARAASVAGAAQFQALDARWARTAGAEVMRATQRLSQAPNPSPITPTPNTSPGIVRPLDDAKKKAPQTEPQREGPEKTASNDVPNDKGNLGKSAGKGLEDAHRLQDRTGPTNANAQTGSTSLPSAPIRNPTPSPMSGGLGSGGSGGGIGSGGGVGSGMGSNPLSHMMGGLGSNPAQGLTGMPNSASSMSSATNAGGLSNPGAAFARGFSSGAGSVVPNTPIQSTSAAGQLASGSGAGPVTGATQSTGAIQAAAGSGMHAASTPAQTAATGPGAPLGLMPSTGMGAPAAAGAGAGGQVIPAGSSSTTTTSGSTAGGAAPVGGNAGATLVPAGVVSAAAGARPQRRLSPDAEAAAALAWQLQHACRKVGYPVDWAVGVFRSEAGTETVVMSSEGSGYVPAGVYLPRSARLLVSDALVDKVFRDRWFGWPDPAQVLVEYARLRQDSGWELVAAATNGPVDTLKNSGVEYADSCTADRSPLTMEMAAPVLDDLHVHRLQLEYPDLFDRLNRLAGAESAYVERILMPISSELMWGVRGQEYPVELRKVWDILTAGKSPAPELWAEYASVAATDFLTATVLRPDVAGGPEEMKCKLYRDAWVVSRALENIAGWAAASPLPVADMVYAAAATDPGADIREKVLVALVDVETELGWR